jgi:uncharacterized delta-60 repeat protein
MKKTISLVLSVLLIAVSFVHRGDGYMSQYLTPALQGEPVAFPFSSGNLDSTFGSNGTVVLSPGPGNDVAQAVAIQSDGKIVTVGYGFNGMFNAFAVTRINPNGTLDSTFNLTGIALTTVGPRDAEAFGVAIQSDGKIVVVGQASNGTNTDFAIVRYNIDGMLDNTFNGDGRLMVDVGGGNDVGRSAAIQNDGKIVIAGNSFVGGNSDISVIRLETHGSFDASFAGNAGNGQGIVRTPVGAGNDIGYSVAVQPNGKIVVAGYYSGPVSIDSVILRYNTDGALDNSFSDDGRFVHAFSADSVDEALAMALQPDGRIVIAGCIRGGGRLNDYLIARIEQDGSLDQTFGQGGFTRIEFSPSPDIALGVAIQNDGKIIAAGFANNGVNNDFGVTRVNTDGTLDTTFGKDGKQLTAFGPSTDSANAVAVQADGKVVVVGRTVFSTADFGIARYGYGTNAGQNDGFIELDPTTDVRFENAFQAGTSSSTTLEPGTVPAMGPDWMLADNARLIHTNALFSGNLVVRLTLPQNIDAITFSAVRVRQYRDGGWFDVTANSPLRDFPTRTIYASITSPEMIVAAWPAVSLSGRVTTPSGLGLRNAVVNLTDAYGERRTATTSSIGYYSFNGLAGGQTYVVTVSSRRYRFAARVVEVSHSLDDMNFIGLE